jgi:microsomal epoxide hydrolase
VVGLEDNPVGQAARIINKFYAWIDLEGREPDAMFSLDELITNVMFYVVSNGSTTSAWISRIAAKEVSRTLSRGSRIEVPMAYASFPWDLKPLPPAALVERIYNLVQFTEYERGSHFAALEWPSEFVEDISRLVRC